MNVTRENDTPLTYDPLRRAPHRTVKNISPKFAGWSPTRRAQQNIRRREAHYYCWIDASALAAVFLAILAAVILIRPRTVDLPKDAADLVQASHSKLLFGARREDAMSVTVDRAGRIYVNHMSVDLDDLPKIVKSGLQSGAERRVYLLVDERSRYSDTKRVLIAIHDAGIENVSFLTNPPR
jgi:biopolymer transport protein ExbD